MDTLKGIRVFRQVVESGSFVAAADRLELSTAMVSKHVMQVEKRLGVRLLNRNSRTLSLTEPGRVYFERSKSILEDLHETELELGALGATPRGTLRVTAPSWFAGQPLARFLTQFHARYPAITVDISFEDRIVDLVEEGYDIAMRVTGGPVPGGLVARVVRQLALPIAASRDYIERHGAPKSPEDLVNHDCAGIGSLDTWSLTGPGGRRNVPIHVAMRFRTNAMAAIASAVAVGGCLGPVPLIYFDDPGFQHNLRVVLPGYVIGEPNLYLVYASHRQLPLKIRTFIDSFLEYVGSVSMRQPIAG